MDIKSGDLAIIIKSVDGLSVGKIVECVQYAGEHSLYGRMWLIESKSSDLVSEYGAVGKNMHSPEKWLRRIPNDPLEDDYIDMTVIEKETTQ